MNITVTTLGTGSPLPDANRAGPSTLVTAGDTRLLVDAGRAVLLRLTAAGVMPRDLTGVLLTHLHSDHITDLNDIVTTHWVMSPEPTPLHVYGPVGTAEVVAGILAMLGPDIGYRLAHHDDFTWKPDVVVHELDPGAEVAIGEASVTTASTAHRPVEPTLGYRIDHGSASVVLGGDGIPCGGLDALCSGAGAYVQTVIRDDLVRMVPNPRFQDIVDYHSTVEQAAQTAARAGVATLVMTHPVPTPFPGQEQDWIDRAAAHFDGAIILAEDLTTLEIP